MRQETYHVTIMLNHGSTAVPFLTCPVSAKDTLSVETDHEKGKFSEEIGGARW